jgi:hypothetical protein
MSFQDDLDEIIELLESGDSAAARYASVLLVEDCSSDQWEQVQDAFDSAGVDIDGVD